jgi:hypothetical protein
MENIPHHKMRYHKRKTSQDIHHTIKTSLGKHHTIKTSQDKHHMIKTSQGKHTKVHHTEDEEERWDERYVRNMSRYNVFVCASVRIITCKYRICCDLIYRNILELML